MIFVVGFGAGSFGMFEECLVFIPLPGTHLHRYGLRLHHRPGGWPSWAAPAATQAPLSRPPTVGVSQSIAGLPMYSAMWYRLIILVVMLTIAAVYIYLYAQRIKRDPTRSLMYEFDRQREEKVDLNDLPELTGTRKLVLLVMGATFAPADRGRAQVGLVYQRAFCPVPGHGHRRGLCGRVGFDGFGRLFSRGVADFAAGALAVGFAAASSSCWRAATFSTPSCTAPPAC